MYVPILPAVSSTQPVRAQGTVMLHLSIIQGTIIRNTSRLYEFNSKLL